MDSKILGILRKNIYDEYIAAKKRYDKSNAESAGMKMLMDAAIMTALQQVDRAISKTIIEAKKEEKKDDQGS